MSPLDTGAIAQKLAARLSMRGQHNDGDEDIAALLAEVATLREALKPFAIAAREYDDEYIGYVISDILQIDGESEIAHPILWGDVRRARRVLEGGTEEPQK